MEIYGTIQFRLILPHIPGFQQEPLPEPVCSHSPDCKDCPYQLLYARSGFGCEPHSSGRAVFATCLSDGETARWNREDFIGVLDEKYLPDWAREKLEELMTQEQTDAPTMGGMNMK